ncbi:MAG: peptide chain release factor N(5)-glutamine methyltransferase [Alistipes sp.]
MTTRRELINRITAHLTGLYDPREARSIAQIVVAERAGLSLTDLRIEPSAPLEIEGLEALLTQLAAGRPVQYVVGATEFYGRRFSVREGVLIPRPETEELVAWIAHDEPAGTTLLDVGCGSGCIAASLALEIADAKVYATDISDEALTIAADNCRQLHATVTLRKADALNNLAAIFPEQFDALVSNPPYVPQSDLPTLHTNVRDYEPHQALLVPDNDPLLFYRAIAHAGRQMLRPKGRLYFEIYHLYADLMEQMLRQEGYDALEVRTDLQGKPRMLCGRLTEA